jgi:hypothetical protein
MSKIKTTFGEWINRIFTVAGIGTTAISIANIQYLTESLIFTALGAGVTTYCVINARKLRMKHEEIGMLRFMALRNGRVSLAEFIIHLEITAERTKQILDRLQNHGVIVVEVTTNGELVYSIQDSMRQIERYVIS